MATGNWTEADVLRINARRGVKSHAVTPTPAAKPSKFRAVPCIVTKDLTLFTREDIQRVDDLAGTPKLGTLQQQAVRQGIIGELFDSTKEGQRYIELARLQQAGVIDALETHPAYELYVVPDSDSEGRTVIGKFTPDFRYWTKAEPGIAARHVVEDVKSPITRKDIAYRLRKRIVEALYGIEITEI